MNRNPVIRLWEKDNSLEQNKILDLMNQLMELTCLLLVVLMASSCVSKKKFAGLQSELDIARAETMKCDKQLKDCMDQVSALQAELDKAKSTSKATVEGRQREIDNLKAQIVDLQKQRDKQLEQVGDLTVLSKEANQNIGNTLAQLEKKDKYIRLLQTAKTKADSINLALAVNLKGVLADGIEDDDVNIQVDKTVVMINLSDKMLYKSGSADITSRANEVLGKIAKIVQSRPDVEVMVEGYTDNVPIKNSCMKDNWDLSVKRATSVVRALQTGFGVDPNRLIAAGRGEFNALASNDTAEGRSTNRRTRIIIMPKLNQFYDLLNPDQVPE